MPIVTPSYGQGFARNAGQSEYPELWRGLVGLWSPSLGPTGLTLYDWSGNKNDGALTNMVAADDWVVGEKGYALDYDGGSDFIVLPHKSSLNLGNIFSISAWIFPRTLNVYQGVWAKIDGGADGLSLRIHNFDKTFGTFSQGNGDIVADNNILTANVWQHVAVVGDGSRFRFYHNGNAVGSPAYNAFAWSNTENAAIGRRNDDPSQFFDGQIGDVSIYNRALLPNEIADMYAGASPLILRRRAVGKVPVTLLVSAIYSAKEIKTSYRASEIESSYSASEKRTSYRARSDEERN